MPRVDRRDLGLHPHVQVEPRLQALGGLQQQVAAVRDGAADVVGQAAVGERHVAAALEDDDLVGLVEPAQAGGSRCAAGHSADDDGLHGCSLFGSADASSIPRGVLDQSLPGTCVCRSAAEPIGLVSCRADPTPHHRRAAVLPARAPHRPARAADPRLRPELRRQVEPVVGPADARPDRGTSGCADHVRGPRRGRLVPDGGPQPRHRHPDDPGVRLDLGRGGAPRGGDLILLGSRTPGGPAVAHGDHRRQGVRRDRGSPALGGSTGRCAAPSCD